MEVLPLSPISLESYLYKSRVLSLHSYSRNVYIPFLFFKNLTKKNRYGIINYKIKKKVKELIIMSINESFRLLHKSLILTTLSGGGLKLDEYLHNIRLLNEIFFEEDLEKEIGLGNCPTLNKAE